jgi:hypothetical protein
MAEDEKKKKKPGMGVIDMGKALYKAYMGRRKQMEETQPETGVREIAPVPPPEEEPTATTPPKKKKKEPPGGVGGVLSAIEERKRRMREAYGD